MKTNTKQIFSLNKELTLEEYQQFIKNFPNFYWSLLKETLFWVFIIFIVGGVVFQRTLLEIFLWSLISAIGFGICYKIRLNQIITNHYYKQIAKHTLYKKSKLEFYNTYLIEVNEDITSKVEYTRIKKTIETPTSFYLIADSHGIIVPKDNCNSEQLIFIKKIQSTHYIDKTKKKENYTIVKNVTKNKNFINILLNIIFIATILSIYGALYTKAAISNTLPATIDITTTWFFWLWLPIPLISILLGIIYKKVVKTQKNIIAGIICSVILFTLGSLAFIVPIDKVEYKEIKPYQEILNIKIPENGIYYRENNSTYYLSGYIEISSTSAYFSDKKVRKVLEKEIYKNKKWIQNSTLKEGLDMLLPYSLRSGDSSYYLIYNNDTAEYNTLPEKSGKYNMIVAVYNKATFELQINKYELNYKGIDR